MPALVHRVGFACVTYTLGLSTSHTFRLSDLGENRLREVLNRNLNDLEAILEWMAEKGLRLFRIGSSLVPFASHPRMKFDWGSMCGKRLEEIGRKYGSMGFRFSMHPGQYIVLNSPKPRVVEQSLAELEYACRVLDMMGLDRSHKVVLHGGGVYGDKAQSLERLERVLHHLPPHVKNRLVLENDERHYHFGHIADISLRSGIPAVFDWHHHRINPCEGIRERLRESVKAWDCRPKVHLSSQKPGAKPGAHDLFVHEEDLEQLLDLLPFDTDMMIEAKAKEAAALEVLQWLRERSKPAPVGEF